MADTKISALTAVTTPADSDLYVIVQGGSNFKATGTQVHATHVAAADPHPGYVLESAAGTIHTQNANNVTITGGSITGITDLAVADGGTGASDASGARTNLGLVIGTNVQAFDADLTTLATAFTTASASTAASLALAEDTDNGSNTVTIIGPTTVASNKVATLQDVTGTLYVSGGADIPVADGGTGSSTASDARTALGVAIGSDVQAFSSVLAATTASFTTADETKLDGIETAADVTDATNVAAAGAVMEADTSTASMSFVIDEDNMVSDSATKVPTQQSVKAYVDASGGGGGTVDSVVAGTNIDVDATDPANPIVSVETLTLADISDVTSSASELNVLDGITASTAELNFTDGVTSAIQTQLDARQPLDADLTTIAGLTATTNNFMVANSSAWASRTPTQAIAHLGLDADLATFSLPASTTISAFGATLVDDAAASNARTTLGLVIGTDVAAFSHTHDLDDLTDVVITTPSTGEVLKYDGANWINDTDATGGGGGALNDLTDVVITSAATGDIVYYNGTNWVDQAIDPDLLTLAVPASTTISTFGASLIDDAAASNARTTLGLVIGTDVQAADADLTTIAGLTATTNNFMVANASAWASRTPTQAIAHLGLDADLATFSVPASTTISAFGATLVDDADNTAARTTLGLGTMATAAAADYLPLVAAGAAVENIGAVESNVNTVASTGATETLDTAVYGVHDMTMNTGCTFTFSNPAPSGKASQFVLILRGAFTPTFPASVDWSDGTPPTYTTPSLYVFTTVDAGTTWLGAQIGKAFA